MANDLMFQSIGAIGGSTSWRLCCDMVTWPKQSCGKSKCKNREAERKVQGLTWKHWMRCLPVGEARYYRTGAPDSSPRSNAATDDPASKLLDALVLVADIRSYTDNSQIVHEVREAMSHLRCMVRLSLWNCEDFVKFRG